MNFTAFELTKSFEGCKLKSYQCPAGVWTIGYGHTGNVIKGEVITQEQADELLIKDIQWAVNAVNYGLEIPVTQNQFDAMVDLCFNIGKSAFLNSTLLRMVNRKNPQAAEQFLRWDKVDGKSVAGLTRRRIAEKELFNG